MLFQCCCIDSLYLSCCSGYSKAQQEVSRQQGVSPVGARRRPELQGIYIVFVQQHFHRKVFTYRCKIRIIS